MIISGKENKDSSIKLLPHQSALLDTFFNPTSKRIIILEGSVGLGKSTAFVSLATRLLSERSTARILFLAPKALGLHFAEMLGGLNTPVVVVDRYRFREMLDSAKGTEIWPQGAVLVLSQDFAKLPDIRDSLAGTTWDAVIVDEAHKSSGAIAKVLRMIEPRAEKLVLAIATYQGQDIDISKIIPEKEKTIIKWRREEVVDHNGQPFNVPPRPILHEITFKLNATELNLRKSIDSLREILESYESKQNFRVKILVRCLESSPAALEAALQRFTGTLEFIGSLDTYMESTDINDIQDMSLLKLDGKVLEKTVEIVSHALQEIDAISEDSKLNAFNNSLMDICRATTHERKICVLTQYLATLYYLAADIEDHTMACQLLHGGMSLEDRHKSLTHFLVTENILVATTSILSEGLDLPPVTDLVLYDIPESKNTLLQILGRFDRLGRGKKLNIHILKCSEISDDSMLLPIETLRELTSI